MKRKDKIKNAIIALLLVYLTSSPFILCQQAAEKISPACSSYADHPEMLSLKLELRLLEKEEAELKEQLIMACTDSCLFLFSSSTSGNYDEQYNSCWESASANVEKLLANNK